MTKPIAITVVVPTFNRAASLAHLLDALHGQAGDVSLEIIVVDNASADATPAVAARYPDVRYVHEPRRGASWARNAGIERAGGSIVAFVDDDVVPARDWARALKRAFDEHPDVDCVGGRVEPSWPRRVPRWMTPDHLAPLALQTGRPAQFDANHASACLVTANLAVRRAVFADVGGFATEFLRDEDREFNLRLWRAGKRGLYADDVRVVAPVDPNRLTKRYHRRWYETTGTNHARLRFREIIDREGRLVPPMAGRAFYGVPAFVYKECAVEIARWLRQLVRGRRADAFYHECRVRYFLRYILTRAQLLLRSAA